MAPPNTSAILKRKLELFIAKLSASTFIAPPKCSAALFTNVRLSIFTYASLMNIAPPAAYSEISP